MRPIHRIPSSIRVRRTETAETYPDQTPAVDDRFSNANDGPLARPAVNDYFSPRSLRRGSASTAGAEADTSRRDCLTPGAEAPWRTSTRSDAGREDDDGILRLEMQAARRAIHDEERREHPSRDKHSSSRSPPDDFPPIRLSDDSLSPQIPNRSSSRRHGAVEGLAMRHHRQRKQERRRKRQEHRNSVSTSSSRSSSTDSRDDVAPNNQNTSRRGSDGLSLHPSNLRNLSDVQEERSSQLKTPSAARPNPSFVISPPTQQADADADPNTKRARRNTVTDEGLMATSRRLYDSLIRRKSDQGQSNSDEEQRRALAPASRYRDDHPDEQRDSTDSSSSSDMHQDEVVDYLDVVDPEVATVTALQNVGNSIFFPPIPMLYSRRPTISLPTASARQAPSTPRVTPQHEGRPEDIELGLRSSSAQQDKEEDAPRFGSMRRMASLVPGRKKKEVPPTTEEERSKHIKEWAQMDEEERNELDEHVRLLLTKKAKFKRAARGFWRYVKTPHGFIITTYAFLITFWGTAICLFLLRWIDVGNKARQRYWIEICDQILCALFTAVGLGFAPFRAVDTYRMVQIVHYHKLTYKRRKELNLPDLKDKNELPRAAPRLDFAQMTNTMMIKTGLRKELMDRKTGTVEQGNATDAADANATNEASAGNETGQGTGTVGALLDPVQSRQSACEVEELKRERRHKHAFFHRKKHSKKSDDEEQRKRRSGGSASSEGSPAPTQHKTYPNKDGIIPLGQLKRNPSIASELPRDAEDVVVLSPKQQANLEYQQRKFHESHTFYRYRETVTHRPFELSLMMAIVILLDCHSCLQASLGGTTWGIYYKNRPTSVTATIITFSLSCNAVAGLLIWWGGNRTKKKEEVERLLGIALEEEALRKMRKKERRRLEAEREARREWAEEGRRLHGGERVAADGEVKFAGETGGDARKETGAGPVRGAEQSGLECIQEH
ncbi:hypothetical protein PHBOTO_005437 [Pseudozyma hubeiensis]|nr:hypothetical protein PHBOTO_005437 [Pseudozyma hubeiensis]